MTRHRPTANDAASVATLIRIAQAAYLAADDILLKAAEIELDTYGVRLADLGIPQVEEIRQDA